VAVIKKNPMSEPDKHHYLPVFYLKQWIGKDGKVARYHRPYQAVVAEPIAPKNTGYERGLYRLDDHEPHLSNVIEKSFMAPVVDDPAAKALCVLLQSNPAKLTPELRVAWTRFIMSLHVRTPDKVEQITQQAAQHLRRSFLSVPEEYEAVRAETDPPTLLEWVEQNTPALLSNAGKKILPDIIAHKEIGDEIINMHWMIARTTENFPDVLTCDHPVIMSHGISDNKCLIALPLSPRFIFFATRNQATLDRIEAHEIIKITKIVNENIVNQARQSVYGANSLHLRFVENRLGYFNPGP